MFPRKPTVWEAPVGRCKQPCPVQQVSGGAAVTAWNTVPPYVLKEQFLHKAIMWASTCSQHAALQPQEETGQKACASAQAAQSSLGCMWPSRLSSVLLGAEANPDNWSSGLCFRTQVICIFYFLAVALGSVISILQLSSGYIWFHWLVKNNATQIQFNQITKTEL